MNSISNLQQIGSQTEIKNSSITQPLGKDDFLTLLVTQLKNQDPLKPSDPTEFTSQLAQYSSLEQLYNINESMKSLDDLKGVFGRLSALSLIDKYVVINSDTFQFDGQEAGLGFCFQNMVREATVYVKNDSGQILDQISVLNPSTGEHIMKWNGKDQNGRQLPPGTYFFSVIGITEAGEEVQGMPMVESRISGVDFSDSGNTLLTNNGRVMLSEIFTVNNPTLTNES
jgi:flagellar basal-body rod modification protein FlgD